MTGLSEQFAISVENLSKVYRVNLGNQAPEERGLVNKLKSIVRTPLHRLRHGAAHTVLTEEFWALRDVGFNVQRGEVLGVIGKNGAGKSTLLKILSRITSPTTGRVEIRGRVASLLEVGTGFHPELTGHENIALNGAILGMSKREIRRKYDEIVEFSGVEQFLHSPVKRYSSGMRVRLAFAVAAHLQPEVLIIDEVLAVGDAAFQRKCIAKMDDVAESGRTILFVSHNMIAIQRLCKRTIWLDDGRIRRDGDSSEVVADYLGTSSSAVSEQFWEDPATAPGNDKVRLRAFRVAASDGTPLNQIRTNTPLDVTIEFWNYQPNAAIDLTMQLINEQDIVIFATSTIHKQREASRFPEGLCNATCQVPANLLNDGRYQLKLMFLQDRESRIYRHPETLVFNVLDTIEHRSNWNGKRPGVVHPLLDWKVVTSVDRNAASLSTGDKASS